MSADRLHLEGCRFHEERFRLPQGLRVHWVARPQRPIVSVALLLPAGVTREAAGDDGRAALTAGLVTMGTARLDAPALAEEIDGFGASLGVAADYDFTVAALSCLARDFPSLLSILAEVLLHPAFLEEEVGRRRAETLGQLARRKDDAGSRVRNRFLARLFGPHPYSHPVEGTAESVERIDRAAITSFHARHYRPEEAVLAVVGDVTAASVRAEVERCFGPWQPGSHPEPEPAPPPAAIAASERIQKDGRTQALVRVGHLAPPRNDVDHLPGLLLNFILGGGGPGCRLMRRLREERGIVYDARSSLVGRRHAGYFFAAARTSRETMDETLEALREEIGAIRAEGITDEELSRAQRFFTGSLPLAFETNDQLATLLLTREFYGLEEEYWLRDLEKITAIERPQIRAAAERLLRPESLTTVCLADFRPPSPDRSSGES